MAEVAEGATNTISNVSNQVTESVSNIAANTSEGVKNTVSKLMTNNGMLVGLIIVIIVAIIAALILNWLVVDNVLNKKMILIERTKLPVKAFAQNQINITDMPLSGNGFKRAYTFWIYINDVSSNYNAYKHVVSIGKSNDRITDLSPLIFLGKTANELFIRFAKADSQVDDFEKITRTNQTNIQGIDTSTVVRNATIQQKPVTSPNKLAVFMKQGIRIKYVPMQRWVHIGIVLSDGVDGATIQTYLDAELAGVVTHGVATDVELTSAEIGVTNSAIIYSKNINNIELDKTGSLFIGGDGKNNSNKGFNGLVSKFKIYNYDLNNKDIYNDYSEGPIDGLLASLGYGLRTPIYKLSDQ